jgi:cytochrome c-type biogenesis protein CcmH
MLLGLALAFMAVAVVATVVLPLMRGVRALPERAAFDRAVYRDQLKEVERDVARGLVDGESAAQARLEIERRLLAAAGSAGKTPGRSGGRPILALVLALLLPAAAALLYLALGAPGVPDQPFADRGEERAREAAAKPPDMTALATELEARLKTDPQQPGDWLKLAGADAALGRWDQSEAAYRRAMQLTQDNPVVATSYGEMLVAAAQGAVTPRARTVFGEALAGDPGNREARYFLALGDAQEGDAASAIAAWQKLAGELPAGTPLRDEIKGRIADAARSAGLAVPELAAPAAGAGSPAGDAQAAQREQMIRGMVDGLAAKLQANPNDRDGWMRLGRSYVVLGEPDKAADAYEHAATLKPADTDALLAEAEALMPKPSPETRVSDRVIDVLKRVEAVDPKQPSALWYLGLAAAQQHRFSEASGYWRRLLAQLPENSQEHKTVSAAIATIEQK